MIVPDDTPPALVAEVAAEETSPAGPRVRLGRLARRFEFDKAVFYALAARAWQTLAGPVTILLIGNYFEPAVRGHYYVFGSLLNYQTFFELNLSIVLLNAAGHEWAYLRLTEEGRVAGDDKAFGRLASLERFGRKWYAAVALICWLGIGGVGLWVFRGLPAVWIAAWVATVTASAVSLLCSPRISILQGCHQVETVNRVAAAQSVSGSLATWACIPAGAGLWAVAASWWAKVSWELWLVLRRYGLFFESLHHRPAPPIRWAAEVWPLQWRIALQAVAATAAFTSFNVALYELRSPAEAGRMGMTWSVLNMLLWGGLAWTQTRIPILAGHSRRGERGAYNRLFGRVALLTTTAVAAGAAGAWAVIYAMGLINLRLAGWFVGPAAFGLLAAAVVAQHAMNCLTIYARTRQRETFFGPNVLFNAAVAAGIWLAVPEYGELGVAAVYAGLAIFVGLPVWVVVWRRDRSAW